MKRQNKNACLKSTRPLPRLRVVVFFGDSLTFDIIFFSRGRAFMPNFCHQLIIFEFAFKDFSKQPYSLRSTVSSWNAYENEIWE